MRARGVGVCTCKRYRGVEKPVAAALGDGHNPAGAAPPVAARQGFLVHDQQRHVAFRQSGVHRPALRERERGEKRRNTKEKLK